MFKLTYGCLYSFQVQKRYVSFYDIDHEIKIYELIYVLSCLIYGPDGFIAGGEGVGVSRSWSSEEGRGCLCFQEC